MKHNSEPTVQKAFISTREGQMEACASASALTPWISMNRAIRAKGGTGWNEEMITNAGASLLATICEDLRQEWNALCEPK